MSRCDPITKAIPAFCAWLLLLGCTAIFFVFTIPHLIKEYSITIAVYEGVVTLFVIANFGLATFMDPGIYPSEPGKMPEADPVTGSMTYRIVDVNGFDVRSKWCTTCRFYRPPRCSHCAVCDRCIEVFDHHCPWVNNCIGRRNYRHFFQFLFLLTVHMLSIFAFNLVFVLDRKNDLIAVDVILAMCVMVISGVLCFPVIGLLCFHVVLVSRNVTTNEQVTGKIHSSSNPYDEGCCYNCNYLFCGPQWPSVKRYQAPLPAIRNGEVLTSVQWQQSTNACTVYVDGRPGDPNQRPPGNGRKYNQLSTLPTNTYLPPSDGMRGMIMEPPPLYTGPPVIPPAHLAFRPASPRVLPRSDFHSVPASPARPVRGMDLAMASSRVPSPPSGAALASDMKYPEAHSLLSDGSAAAVQQGGDARFGLAARRSDRRKRHISSGSPGQPAAEPMPASMQAFQKDPFRRPSFPMPPGNAGLMPGQNYAPAAPPTMLNYGGSLRRFAASSDPRDANLAAAERSSKRGGFPPSGANRRIMMPSSDSEYRV